MFHSATLKMTLWYLIILMGVGIMFSAIIYQLASAEVSGQLEIIRQQLRSEAIVSQDFDFTTLQSLQQARQAQANLFTSLVYLNLSFLAVGGVASYFMARRALEPIEQAHETQSRFTSDASHELRTPLAIMKTELEVALKSPNLSKAEMRDTLSSSLEEVNKLSQISQSLLLLSRLDHGALDIEKIDINGVVSRVVKALNRRESRIVYTPPKTKHFVAGHEISIEELVTILLDNALKYSPPSSKVQIMLTKKGKKSRLVVKNAGAGISPDEIPYIFDRFYRADLSRTGGKKSGFGLGLSLAKKIVEAHEGDLSATSQLGKETVFVVLLPIYETAPRRNKRARNQT